MTGFTMRGMTGFTMREGRVEPISLVILREGRVSARSRRIQPSLPSGKCPVGRWIPRLRAE
jgi:hypothetical protein